jgi:serine phosphatase RsbU (regulator of sigma subunit)
MSLRTRLVIAFVILSVVPLSAVTLFSYLSSVHAFERAAQRETAQSAADIARRMEMMTTDLGRRMDRLFEVAGTSDSGDPDPDVVRARIAPMLGDAAGLIDRVEFHPEDGHEDDRIPPRPTPDGGHTPPVRTERPGSPPGPNSPPPPAPPRTGVIVVDVPKIVEEARRQAKLQSKASGGPDVSSLIDGAVRLAVPVAEAAMSAAADAMRAEAAKEEATARAAEARAEARAPEMDVKGRRMEVMVKKDGRLLGRANAYMNLDRMLGTVLGFARREQGEIPFAIDQQNVVHTPEESQRPTLTTLNVAKAGAEAASGSPQRVGDWLVVARRDPSGLVFGIARPIGQSLREIRSLSFRNLSIGLGVIALACIGIVPVSRRMTQHVSALSAGVRQLAGGDFSTRVPVQSSDEFGALATAFNRMAADLERHQSLVVEQERLHRELELSRQIQTEMLPRAPLRLGPAEIKGVSIPAREVGGDFFNYFALPDGRMALLIGDVSGKGVSAALLMANIQATLRARLPLETDLPRLADFLDRDVDANTPHSVYVTLFLAILDVQGRRLQYVNAGHNPQFLLGADGTIKPLASTGMPIALYSGQGYQGAQVPFGPGDLLFFYTDGLVETENEKGEMFGADRLQAIIADEHQQGVDRVLERVEEAVRTFRGRAEPFDDATMMALRVNT